MDSKYYIDGEGRDETGRRYFSVALPEYSAQGALYWYVKVARKGRRINISEEYSTPAFDAAYEAVAALGGVLRMRRIEADVLLEQPERRYLYADVSQREQLRYYVQLRKGVPKIRIRGAVGAGSSMTQSIQLLQRRSPNTVPKAIISMPRNSGMKRAHRYRAWYIGTGRCTKTVTLGSAISRWATRGYPKGPDCSAPA